MKTALAIVFVMLSTTIPALAETMTAAEIEAELIGKTLCVKNKQNQNICVRHKVGGVSEVVSGPELQTGVWRFKGNKHCTKWQKIRAGKEFCSNFEKYGSSYSNSFSGKITLK